MMENFNKISADAARSVVPRPRRSLWPPVFRKHPQQKRSRALVAWVETACERILRTQGMDALSPRQLADEAGIEVGSLYQYFPNVEGVIAEVCRKRICQHVKAEELRLRALKCLTLEDALRSAISVMTGFHATMYRLIPDFYLKYSGYFDLSESYDKMSGDPHASSDFLRKLIERHWSHSGIPLVDPELKSALTERWLNVAIEEAVLFRPALLDDGEFQDYLLKMCLALTGSSPNAANPLKPNANDNFAVRI